MPKLGLNQAVTLPLREVPMPPQLFCGQPGTGQYAAEELAPIENLPRRNKPKGGVWTSTYTPDSEYCSAWIQWCVWEEMCKWVGGEEDCTVLTVERDARVYEIDSQGDLLKLYGRERWRRKLSSYLEEYIPDFEALAKAIDGIHLTEKGQRETRLIPGSNLYGWDTESTIWFRDAFEDARPLSEEEERSCVLKEINRGGG